jgi:hypothetical protein
MFHREKTFLRSKAKFQRQQIYYTHKDLAADM